PRLWFPGILPRRHAEVFRDVCCLRHLLRRRRQQVPAVVPVPAWLESDAERYIGPSERRATAIERQNLFMRDASRGSDEVTRRDRRLSIQNDRAPRSGLGARGGT